MWRWYLCAIKRKVNGERKVNDESEWQTLEVNKPNRARVMISDWGLAKGMNLAKELYMHIMFMLCR